MLAYLPVEKMLDKTEYSIYKLVNLAAKRAMEIANGQPKLINTDASLKPLSVALYEIFSGKIKLKK